MLRTTKDLVNEFQAATGYTQSDEITLIFPPQYEEDKANPGAYYSSGSIWSERIKTDNSYFLSTSPSSSSWFSVGVLENLTEL